MQILPKIFGRHSIGTFSFGIILCQSSIAKEMQRTTPLRSRTKYILYYTYIAYYTYIVHTAVYIFSSVYSKER